MTHEKSLKKRKHFSRPYKHTRRDISSSSHPAHGCGLSLCLPVAICDGLHWSVSPCPTPSWHSKPTQNSPMEGASMKSLTSQPSESSPLLQNYHQWSDSRFNQPRAFSHPGTPAGTDGTHIKSCQSENLVFFSAFCTVTGEEVCFMLTPRARGKERGEGKLVREQEAAVEVGVASSGGSRISTDAQSRRESGRSGGASTCIYQACSCKVVEP